MERKRRRHLELQRIKKEAEQSRRNRELEKIEEEVEAEQSRRNRELRRHEEVEQRRLKKNKCFKCYIL